MTKPQNKGMSPDLEVEYDTWLKRLGRTIAGIRKDRGLTQSEMARVTKFDMKYYQDVEYGRRPVTTRTLFQLCEGMGISLQNLINLTEKTILQEDSQS